MRASIGPYTESHTVTNSPEIAKLLAGNFIERRDAKAIQIANGDYQPHRVGSEPLLEDRRLEPFDLTSLIEHVEGKQTYGHYLINPDTQTARCFVFDIDLNKSSPYHDPDLDLDAEINPREVWYGPTTTCKRDLAVQLTAMAHGLACRTYRMLGCKTIVSYSGNKGMHVIGCFDPGTSAAVVRAAAHAVLETAGCFVPTNGENFWKHATGYPSLDIEIFPKQDEVKPGSFGNLVRLPLGINRRSGKESWFVKITRDPTVFTKDDPLEVLTNGSVR